MNQGPLNQKSSGEPPLSGNAARHFGRTNSERLAFTFGSSSGRVLLLLEVRFEPGMAQSQACPFNQACHQNSTPTQAVTFEVFWDHNQQFSF